MYTQRQTNENRFQSSVEFSPFDLNFPYACFSLFACRAQTNRIRFFFSDLCVCSRLYFLFILFIFLFFLSLRSRMLHSLMYDLPSDHPTNQAAVSEWQPALPRNISEKLSLMNIDYTTIMSAYSELYSISWRYDLREKYIELLLLSFIL